MAKFYTGVRAFFEMAVEYALKTLPLSDDLLQAACCINVQQRETINALHLEFFVHRYVTLFLIIHIIELRNLEDTMQNTTLMGQNDFYVMSRFSDLLPYSSSDELAKLSEEVTEFQLLSDENIPQHVWDDALVKSDENGDGGYYRQDVLWQYLSTLKSSDGRQMFKRLSKIAMLVLVIPHSNASEERVFSMVRKKNTLSSQSQSG